MIGGTPYGQYINQSLSQYTDKIISKIGGRDPIEWYQVLNRYRFHVELTRCLKYVGDRHGRSVYRGVRFNFGYKFYGEQEPVYLMDSIDDVTLTWEFQDGDSVTVQGMFLTPFIGGV